MLTGIGIIFLSGLFFGTIFKKLHLPSLMGMIIAGIIIGPYCLNLIDSSVLNIAADLRQFALVIILSRAGLTLNIDDLKKVGLSAVLMCFVPACFEITATTLIAPRIFDISYVDAGLMGAVLGAVSPAVIVPRMIKIMEEGYGTKKSIPQLILAGASADDVFVIVVFTSLLSLSATGNISAVSFIQIPVSIILGIVTGIACGILLNEFYKKFELRSAVKLIVMLSVSFLLVAIENNLKGKLPISGLLAIMAMGITLFKLNENTAKELSNQYNQLWIAGEIILFVLVGAAVDVSYAVKSGFGAVIILAGALIIRMIGVFISILPAKLNLKERLFCMFAYTPKATVQAAIGAIPLTMGLSCGHQILTVAVLAILISAPLGAILVDNTYKKFLHFDK